MRGEMCVYVRGSLGVNFAREFLVIYVWGVNFARALGVNFARAFARAAFRICVGIAEFLVIFVWGVNFARSFSHGVFTSCK